MTQIKSVLYLSGLSLHQFVYVIFNEPCDRWKFAQNIFTFMKLKSKQMQCETMKKSTENFHFPSIHPSIHPLCLHSISLILSQYLLRDAYKLLSFVSMYVFECQCSQLGSKCLSFVWYVGGCKTFYSSNSLTSFDCVP